MEYTILAEEQIAEKVADLERKYSTKINPIVFTDSESGEQIIGYLKEPSREVKFRVMDKALMFPVSCGRELIELCLLKDESDPRFSSEDPKYDKIAIGAAKAATELVRYYIDQYKKK